MNEPSRHDAPDLTTRAALSIVIPVYNESGRIEACLAALREYTRDFRRTVEILVVDDGSDDDTVVRARRFARANRDGTTIQVIAEHHRGKAAAVFVGLRAASGEIVGFMDVDLAISLDTLHPCIDAIEHGFGVAIASREGEGAVRVDEPHYRHVMGRAFNTLVRLLLLPGIHDTQCGFKFFSRAALDDILPRCGLYQNAAVVAMPRVTAFDVELLYIARIRQHRIRIVPSTWHYGAHSKVNPISDTLQNLLDVLTVRLNGWRGRYR